MSSVPAARKPNCSKCGAAREFYGGQFRCRECERNRTRAWRKNMPDKEAEKQRQRANELRDHRRAARSPEQKASDNATVTAWHAQHPDRVREIAREWRSRNVETARSNTDAWRKRNPERYHFYSQKRRAMKLDAICEHGEECVGPEFTSELLGRPCEYCGDASEHIDHFYPLSRGGLHCRENLRPACADCNKRKWARDPHEWLASR